jgi:hypothetical protein
MIVLTTKGAQYLSRHMIAGARRIYKDMLNWLNRGDERFPKPSDILPTNDISSRGEALHHIADILGQLT